MNEDAIKQQLEQQIKDNDSVNNNNSIITTSNASNDNNIEPKNEEKSDKNDESSTTTDNTNTSTTTTTTTTNTGSVATFVQTPPTIGNQYLTSLIVFNLPKYWNNQKLSKYLESNQVPFTKAKKIVKETFGFIFFDDQKSKEKIFELLNGKELDNQVLKVSEREEKADRMKRKFQDQQNKGTDGDSESTNQTEKKQKCDEDNNNNNNKSNLKTIEEICCPWYNIKYEEQIERKKKQIEKVLVQIKTNIRKESQHNMPTWLTEKGKGALCCPLETVVASPMINNYRNKATYTIGRDSTGQPCVGFSLGKTGNGITVVADPSNAPIISVRSNSIRKTFEEYIKSSVLPPFDKNTHTGFWRQLVVRDFENTGESMATIQVNHKDMSKEQIDQQKQQLVDYFQTKIPQDQRLTSLSIQLYDGVSNAAPVDLPVETLIGNDRIHETLLGYRFQVSSNAFFQVNSKATELLYSKVLEWAQVSENTHLFDICCGTGTIGQCISHRVKSVIGLELSPDAVEDAKKNAEINQIKNISYHVGKAEETLPGLLQNIKLSPPSDNGGPSEYVGIVDPPRGGLHNDVVKAIRSFEPIKKLIYVSCNQNSLIPDSVRLCKGISKSFSGTPFKPTKAIAFDLFPHTDLVELVVLFERS
eukprot:gene6241-7772_t